ncbi:hypothetical protein [Ralstonia pickettii]|uniref:hypothetical protein n=1 Tax=Ralstonia pickettii TaxID=329 RepID=UPI0015C12467|nr:hypothetical protein [Ralstonia pickettii]NWK46453.1 hypothetical protein [Ralstonia pickettii]
MTKTRVLFCVFLVASALLLYLGANLYLGVVAQKVPGYPSRGQFFSSILLPCALVVSNIVLIGFSARLRWPSVTMAVATQFIAFLVFAFLMTGGV